MKRTYVAMTAIGCIFVAIGFLTVWQSNVPPVPEANALRPVPEIVPNAVDSSKSLAFRSKTPLLEGSQLMQEAILEDADQTPSTLTQIDEMVLENNASMAEFAKIREKSLRTREEQRRYEAMLADPIRILESKEMLLAATATQELSQEEELERIHHLKFLTAAADWSDNPQRMAVFEAITEVVLAELPPDMSDEQRGSILGDKVDLYQHLVVAHAQQAQKIKQDAEGTSNERILVFAENMLKAPEETANATP